MSTKGTSTKIEQDTDGAGTTTTTISFCGINDSGTETCLNLSNIAGGDEALGTDFSGASIGVGWSWRI